MHADITISFESLLLLLQDHDVCMLRHQIYKWVGICSTQNMHLKSQQRICEMRNEADYNTCNSILQCWTSA